MASAKAHGVVMVYTNTMTIHDPEKGHVDDKPTMSDWEIPAWSLPLRPVTRLAVTVSSPSRGPRPRLPHERRSCRAGRVDR